ncbi:unnamed protein product [Periconia digitata]|uniref:SET domain-containing protein n=1 Tax=Periconia digitata TaxID=1303443 RepID=A0A9W4UM21_9PLEO|nr:unnamed protein product [Periconia digitata]
MISFTLFLMSLSTLPSIHASQQSCKPPSSLELQNICPFPPEPYIVLPSKGKGLGVFARTNLPAGTIILRETPILTIPPPIIKKGAGYPMPAISSAVRAEFRNLPSSSQSEILTLHHHAFPGEPEKGEGWTDILGYIFRTNAYNTGTNIGLFPRIARINHSCRPNAAYTWNARSGQRIVYASRAIEAGEEISDSYISLLLPRAERRKRLARYGFECTCEACSLAGKKLKESDDRRMEIASAFKMLEDSVQSNLTVAFSTSSSQMKEARLAANQSMHLLSLLEREQLADYYAKAYRAVAVSHARVQDWEMASVWANKGFERRVMEDPGSSWTVEMAEMTRSFIEEWKKELGQGGD